MKIVEEQYVPESYAKKVLEVKDKEKTTEELGYEQKNALEYLKKHVELSHDKAEKLIEELKAIEGLREEQIVSIVDIMPKDKDDLRVILTKERFALSEEQVDKILELVSKYL